MRKLTKYTLVLLLMALWCLPGYGAVTKVGTVGLKFLDIGVGARPLAMGETFVAVADDATSLFWNPAGIAKVERFEAVGGYTSWPADVHLYSGGLVYNMPGYGAFGLSFTNLYTGEMNVTSPEFPDGNGGTFTAGDWAAGLTYARFLTDRFSFGATFKLVHEELYDYDVNGWAADVGTYYDTGYRSIRIGMSIMNFGPDLRYEIDNDDDGSIDEDKIDGQDNDGDGITDEDPEEAALPLPLSFRIGLAMDLLDVDVNRVTLLAELMHPSDNDERYQFGAEYWYSEMLALRTGYKVNADEGGFTAGAGVKLTTEGLGSVSFDYAFTDFGRLDQVHRGSFNISF
jgi:hypothetical protein